MNRASDQEKEQESFEAAFKRLEEILNKMNSANISLDESLKLYEEADRLINTCSKRLNDAERKIDVLIKNRNGEVVMDGNCKPVTQSFNPNPL